MYMEGVKKLHTSILVIALLLLILVGCAGPKTQTDEARVYVEDFLNLLKTNDSMKQEFHMLPIMPSFIT